MVGLTIAVAGVVAVVVLVATRLGRGRLGRAFVGMLVGFVVGVIANETIGLLHFFAAVDVPDPVIQIGGVATTLATIYPVVFGVAGLAVGMRR